MVAVAGKVAEKATRCRQVAKKVEMAESASRVVADEVRANGVHPQRRLPPRLRTSRISRSQWQRQALREEAKATKAEERKAERVRIRKEEQGEGKATEVVTGLQAPLRAVDEAKVARRAAGARAALHLDDSATRCSPRLTERLREHFSILCHNKVTIPPKAKHRRAFGGVLRAHAIILRMVALALTHTT